MSTYITYQSGKAAGRRKVEEPGRRLPETIEQGPPAAQAVVDLSASHMPVVERPAAQPAVLPLSPVAATEASPPVPVPGESVVRRLITPSRQHRAVETLSELKKETTDPKETVAINAAIREVKNSPALRPGYTGAYLDLAGETIGSIEHKSVCHGTELALATTDYVKSVHFDLARPQPGVLSGGVCLRISAILNEAGIDVISRAVKVHLRKRAQWQDGRRGGSNRSNLDIRREMRRRSSYNIRLAGEEVHINLTGKVEIFFPWRIPEANLARPQDLGWLTPQMRKLVYQYTAYASDKRWIRNTSPQINAALKGCFERFANVLKTLFEQP